MNLARAVEIAGAPALLPVPADAEELRQKVAGNVELPVGRSLLLACDPGGIVVRPVEALHLLSLVTRHASSSGDLRDAYAWWGLLKYLDFFDHDPCGDELPALRVSRAGSRVAGVQRRVASEELGVAFGVLVASRRFREESGPGAPVGIIDVDLMVHGSGQGSSPRPDYVLVASPEGHPAQGMPYFLECKGTSNPENSEDQLVKAVGQIAVLLPGYSAPGLAVSTVTGPRQMSYVALELASEDAVLEDPRGKPRREHSDPVLGADAGAARDFIQAGLRSSWCMLGYYAGNLPAVRQWSDRARGTGAVPAYWREREQIDSEFGDAIGISETFDLGDRQLIIIWAVNREVDDTLTHGDPEDVLAAQKGFAENLDETIDDEESEVSADSLGTDDPYRPGTQVESAMPDGSIFSLTVR